MTTRTTFQVSLFLPYTIDFDALTSTAPTPLRTASPPPTLRRITSGSLDGSSALFGTSTPPQTPAPAAEILEFFAQDAPPSPDIHFAKPNNPRVLRRTDSHTEEWGNDRIFRQPRSRAAPPPPSTILEYAKAQERVAFRALSQIRSRSRTLPTPPRSNDQSRSQSIDKAFEETDWTVQPAIQGNGGLTNAIRAVSEGPDSSHHTWVGTLGFPTDALHLDKKSDIEGKLEGEYDAMTVFVSDSDFDGHYSHYCKMMLWPVFHYQIPDHPKSKAYEDHSWQYYVNVNQAFADKVSASFKRDDIVWIHDYHLLLVPQMIRKKHPNAQIGFFLHTAFPSSEVFRCLAVRKQLLEGMLGANLIAFQCPEYAHHFLQTCSRLLVVEATSEGVQLDDHFVNVTSCPMGIIPEQLELAREEPEVGEWIQVIQERYEGKKLIVARDKLDNIRGVKQKLLAYEMFLEKNPDWREKVVLVQVATSTTGDDHKDLQNQISDIANRISSRYSTLAHQPLVFLKQDIAFNQYLALLTVADVLMVTSLRDGMNLSSHEYIICQDGKASPKKHGPLILSEFTGAASIFGGNELSINPWDYKQCSKAILKALEMSSEERERRHTMLMNLVMQTTGTQWVNTLAKELRQAQEGHQARDAMSVPRLSLNQLSDQYKAASQRLFILDYEGTLTPWGSPTTSVLSSPQRVIDTLNDLMFTTSDQKNIVYIMSGQSPEELEHIFGQVPSVGLIAENGCFIREFESDTGEWVNLADMDKAAEWKESVKGILGYYHERIEGSWIEERHCSLIFHYDGVSAEDFEGAARQAGDCVNHIIESCRSQRVHAIPVEKAVIIEPFDWNKLTAAKWILERLGQPASGVQETTDAKMEVPIAAETTPATVTDQPTLTAEASSDTTAPPQASMPIDFLMVAGDDREDEAVFKWANSLDPTADTPAASTIPNIVTVHVGKRGATEAGATLTQGTHGLLTALQKLARLNDSAAGVWSRGRAR